jgi:4-hydroxy-tetrahydrodipicolinate reductase
VPAGEKGKGMSQQSNKDRQRLRVVQWATGNIGTRAMRRVIEHPLLELVGLYVHSADKVGRDAGGMCGMAPCGVIATNRIEEVIALRPDCVLYMPRATSYDEVCALLQAGINIVTTRGDFARPASMPPDRRARVEAAAEAGHASIHSTGISPGFKTENFPLLLTALQRRLDHLSIDEFSDVSSRNSPDMLFGTMGFGAQPGPVDPRRLHMLRDSFAPSLELVADAIRLPLDDVAVSGMQAVARRDTRIAAGLVPAGTVAATRTIVSGRRAGHELMRFSATWYVTDDIVKDGAQGWEFRSAGWHVTVRGDVPLDVSVRYPVPPEDYAAMTPNLTAHGPVNAIEFVCAAAPGIRTSVDLPPIIARLG